MRKCSIVILMLLVFSSVTKLMGQNVYSPYSNFGIGNLSDTRSATIKSMGKSYAAYRDFMCINYDNPASYTAFDTMSFVLDASLEIESLSLYTSNNQMSSTYCGFGSVQFGFPISKHLKASAGLIPTSNVGYAITTETTDDITGTKKYQFIGEGGLSNAYFGLGLQLGRNISIGANLSYVFGSILKTHAQTYPDSSFFFNTKILDELTVGSLYTNMGAQYNGKIAKDLFLTVGAAYSPELNLKVKQSIATYNYTVANGLETLIDTVYLRTGAGNLVSPQKIAGGIMLKKLNRYKFLLNFEWQQWSRYEVSGIQQTDFNDSYMASIGYEHSPRAATVSSYFKWVKYRMGAYYKKTSLVIDGHPINQYGVTFGLGLPIVRSASTVNITIDIGGRGSMNNNLIQESYINATLAFSLYDTWFYRVKYK